MLGKIFLKIRFKSNFYPLGLYKILIELGSLERFTKWKNQNRGRKLVFLDFGFAKSWVRFVAKKSFW